MKPRFAHSSIRMPAGLAAGLLLSHLAAALLAIAIAGGAATPVRGALALAAGAAAGVALTAAAQRTLWLVGSTLRRLNDGQTPPELPVRWHGPLADLVDQVNALAGRVREVTALRESLLHQARESAAQQERNRLARDLHDSIKQQIFSISMSAAAAQARWEGDPAGAREALGDVRRSAQEAMVEMNALLQQLSPVPLEKVGLVQALRDQCEALGHRAEVDVSTGFGTLPGDDRLPPGAQESLFRIAQEALSNVARHARADRVRLYLGQRVSDGPLVLEIADDGQGFAAGAVNEGMGLANIRQRVLALGGELSIDSTPGGGTTLAVRIPLVEPVPSEEEAMDTKADHTLNKALLVGLGGGLALIAVLFYPLYVLLPGRYVAGWFAGSGAVGSLLEVVAVLVVASTGYLAARWVRGGARQEGALIGALSGGVAGSILHFGIGAPAMGIVGGGLLLEHGLTPAAGDAALVRLLAESVVGLAWWLSGAFWVSLLAGMGLGAIGGALAPPAANSPDRSGLGAPASVILATSTLVSAMSLVVSVAVFSLLESTIRTSLARHGIPSDTSLPLAGITLWLIGTPVVFYLASLIALYFLLRADAATDDPSRLDSARATTAVLGLLSLAVSIFLLLMNAALGAVHQALGIAGIVMVAASLVLGGLYLATFVKINRRRWELGAPRPRSVQVAAAVGVVLSMAGIVWAVNLPLVPSVLVGLVIIAADAALIVLLRRLPRPSPTGKRVAVNPQAVMSRAISASLGLVFAFIIPTMANSSVTVSMIMITVTPVAVLTSYQGQRYTPDYNLIDLVRNAYLTQARVFLFVLLTAIVGIGLGLLIYSGIFAITKRQAGQEPEQIAAPG